MSLFDEGGARIGLCGFSVGLALASGLTVWLAADWVAERRSRSTIEAARARVDALGRTRAALARNLLHLESANVASETASDLRKVCDLIQSSPGVGRDTEEFVALQQRLTAAMQDYSSRVGSRSGEPRYLELTGRLEQARLRFDAGLEKLRSDLGRRRPIAGKPVGTRR